MMMILVLQCLNVAGETVDMNKAFTRLWTYNDTYIFMPITRD